MFSGIKWSASRIDVANYCRMRYYLKYVEKEKSLKLPAYVKGSLLHSLIEHFWERNGTPEEVVSKSKEFKNKKYFDAESFAKYAQGKWMRTIIADEHSKEKIYWRDKNEKWMIKSNLAKICMPLYKELLEEGPPIFSELAFDFILDNRYFYVRIDEIRKKDDAIIIRDYKSGSPWLGSMKVNHDPQLTIYNLGLGVLCYKNRDIAKKLGLEDKIVDRFMGNPIYINPDFEEEFFMIEALAIDPKNPNIKTIPEKILKTKRKDEHYFELIKMIDGTQTAVINGDIHPERGRKCDICDMKLACEKKLDQVNKGYLVDKKGQFSLDFFTPSFIKDNYKKGDSEVFPLSIGKEEPVKKDKTQKRFRFRYTL